MYIYAYNVASKSARALADALGATMIRHEASRFKGGQRKTVLNWGSSELPAEVGKCRVLNRSENVRIAGNKKLTLEALSRAGIGVPPFTSDRNIAVQWLQANRVVVARKVLTGHSGNGIIILESGDEFEEAPLYTQYIPKTAEYRVHVISGRIVDIQRKIKDPERDVSDWKVRSHGNGFIFVRNNDQGVSYMDVAEKPVKDLALQSVQILGLDFGAADVIWNKKQGRAYILEVNTACGLEGHSIGVYTEGLKRLVG